jgi:hypothetical protein
MTKLKPLLAVALLLAISGCMARLTVPVDDDRGERRHEERERHDRGDHDRDRGEH